ncbi:PREDICTED: protein DOS2-like isoform X4 [Populus euphratica]|uniref:Protein DOS2-like isoform X3 n=1 Tax=Populus euphratica TaxID=75702 RepID=A0AAJ6X5Z3_POPEU|nr:PREDICTED: protein DOS2-like isoform X3 [Populus euphratica]XP_011006600.1 PREDICTED: protein DOS2-like isoform X4 [Populus euphratica]
MKEKSPIPCLSRYKIRTINPSQMNFFKSVFADDTTPPDSPNSHSPPNKSTSEDPNPTTQNPTWSLGSLIQTLATKSESVMEIYKKDLEEFGSGLKKETAIIRDVASRAVHDLPASFEASAAVAQETIDGIGSTMWKSTAQIISQGKDSILDADHDRDLLSSNADGSRSNLSKQKSLDVKYNRFDAQVHALQSDLDTYCSEPEDKVDYEKWKVGGLVIDENKEEIERLITENGVIRDIYNEVVPNRVDDDSFWSRYFYRMLKLKQTEEARALLVKRVISGDEEDLSWDFDDDKEEGDVFLSKGESSKDAKVEKVNVDEVINENLEEKEKVGVDRSEDKLEEKAVVVEGKGSTAELCKDDDTLEEKDVVVKGEEHDGISCKDSDKLEEKAVVVKGEGHDGISCKDSDKLEEKVVEGKGGNGGSCKDSDVSVVTSQSLPEEDLEWDEIEDIGSNDESKGEAVGSGKSAGTSKVDLQKRLSAAEEEDDFSWDIEDEDVVHVK